MTGLYRKFDYWKRKATKKTYIRAIGIDVYKLLLNFMLLSIIGLLTWTGIRLFSHQMAPLPGSIGFILEFITFIWLSRVVSRNGWRRPSLKLTVFSLLGIALVLSFAGVQPLSTYKDTAIDKITTWTSAIEIEEPTAEEPVVDLPTVDLQFDTFQDDSTGFSFEYPESWSINKVMRPDEEEIRVLLSGRIGGIYNGELLVSYDFTNSYTEWFSIYDSPLTATSLEEEGTAYGMPYHKFIQTVEGKTSQVYLCDAPEGVVSVTYSYNVKEASSNDVAKLEGYALHVIATYSVDKPEPPEEPAKLSIEAVEELAFNLINQEREKEGLLSTKWDNDLYKLSKVHTQKMADRGELFHTPVGASYGENAWGASWGGVNRQSLASTIVGSWMSSPLHRAWILHGPLRASVVSIVDDDRGQYASWTFWTREAGEGPALVKKAYELWQKETGGDIPWLEWLYDIKGYPYNTEFLE